MAKQYTPAAKQPLMYKGVRIVNVRPAKKGDPGFVAGRDQVVVTFKDGAQKTVMRQEVTGSK